jgi:hypothetical protein
MITIVIGGIVAAAAILFLVFKFGKIRRVLAFDIPIDILSTVTLTLMLAGTFVGMMTALFAGAIISIVLFSMKKTIGHDKITIKGWKQARRPEWMSHE